MAEAQAPNMAGGRPSRGFPGPGPSALRTRLDDVAVRIYRWRRPHSAPDVDELINILHDQGSDAVMERLVKLAETRDRQLTAFLAGSGFIAAVAGVSLTASVDNPGLVSPAPAFAVLAFLAAMRGIARYVGPYLAFPVDWETVAGAYQAFVVKTSWGWLSALFLRASVGWLLLLSVLLAIL